MSCYKWGQLIVVRVAAWEVPKGLRPMTAQPFPYTHTLINMQITRLICKLYANDLIKYANEPINMQITYK